MPRLPRYILPGHPQHVIQRGVNRCPIFVGEQDYDFYKHYLQEACMRHDCRIHAYVLMSNHVHLLMTPEKKNSFAKVMQSVGRRYVQYFNTLYQRTGTLWEGRYKATVIDSEEYLLTCYRYIELNPVRAKLVPHPRHYTWSSYGANAMGKTDSLITPHELYLALASRHHQRHTAYQELFQTQINSDTLDDIRQATQKGWALGNDRFKDEIEQLAKRRTRPLPKSGDRRSSLFRVG